MPNANDALFDAANRHQAFLIRFGGSSAREASKLLKKAEADLINRIAGRVDRLGPAASASLGSKRLVAIKDAIRQQNVDLMNALHSQTRNNLTGLASQEVDIASRRLNEAVGIDLNNQRPSPEVLRTLVEKRAVGAVTLRQWFTRLGRGRLGRLESAVNLGVIEGDTIQQITRRFRDAEGVTRRQTETLVRTHVNHVANQSRQALYEANSDLVGKLRWTATLDSRTSSICQSRDGKTFPLNSGPRPPAHPNCRSIMTPVLKSWRELAKPGTLRPIRGATDIDRLFKKNLRKQGFSTAEAGRIKRNTRASMNGQVPKVLNYPNWLKKQPKAFRREVLGPTKAKLFDEGNLSLDRFVDSTTGRPFTLADIRQRNEETYMRIFPPQPIGVGDPLSAQRRKEAVDKWVDDSGRNSSVTMRRAKELQIKNNVTDSLTDAELQAIHNYTDSGYENLNGTLRKHAGKIPDADDVLGVSSDTLERAIKKMPKHEGTVYRDIFIPSGDQALLDHYVEGKVIKETTWLSTSRDMNRVKRGTRWIINSKNGRDVQKLSRFHDEQEILFPPNTRFRVLHKAVEEGDTRFKQTTIWLEEI